MKTMLKEIEKMKNKNFNLKVLKENCSVELNGSFELKKGSFKIVYNYWAKTYAYKDFKNLYFIDDFEVATDKYFFSNLEINNFNDFKNTIQSFGIDELKNIFEITHEEERNFMYECLKNHVVMKKINPFSTFDFELTIEEKRNLFLNAYAIDKKIRTDKYFLNQFNVTEEDLKEINENK